MIPLPVGFRFSSTRTGHFRSLRECSAWTVCSLSSRWYLVRNASSGPRDFTANTSTWGHMTFSEVLLAYVAPPPLEVHSNHGSCSRLFMGPSRGGPHEVSQLRCLCETYRVSPIELARYARIPTKYEAYVVQQVRQIGPNYP